MWLASLSGFRVDIEDVIHGLPVIITFWLAPTIHKFYILACSEGWDDLDVGPVEPIATPAVPSSRQLGMTFQLAIPIDRDLQ